MITIKKKVKRAIERYNMLSKGETVLVGVSGGPDSVALLYLLREIRNEYGISLKVAHLNHGFRKEAADEAKFVGKIADLLDLPITIRAVDVPAIKETNGLSAQEAAREARYVFFAEAAKEAGANRIAIAHTADDQAETVLIRLLRGSGPLGLSGIPPVRKISCQESKVAGREPLIIRPLIDCSRREVENYLSERNIPFITDSSNLKMDYLRNRIRMELLPFLEGYNPNVKDTLVRTAEVIHRDEQFLYLEAERAYNYIVGQQLVDTYCTYEGISMGLKALKELHPSILSRVIRKAIKEVKGDLKRISFQHITDITCLMDSGEGRWSLHLPGVTVSREQGKLIFQKGCGRR